MLWTDGCDKVAPGTSLGSHSKELETPTTRVSKFARKNGEEGTFEDWGAVIKDTTAQRSSSRLNQPPQALGHRGDQCLASLKIFPMQDTHRKCRHFLWTSTRFLCLGQEAPQ